MIARTFILAVTVALSAVTLPIQGVAIDSSSQLQDIAQRDIPSMVNIAQEQALALGLMRRNEPENVVMEPMALGSVKPVFKAACKMNGDYVVSVDGDNGKNGKKSGQGHRSHNHHGNGHDNNADNVKTSTMETPTGTATSVDPTSMASTSSGSAIKATHSGATVGLLAVALAAYMF
ncbi:hypothetical protein BGZ46_007678 [Entomortierella lignicola]|nr:hypothetical protein BGZ46_007678 [Entomortierella lignicola]